MFAAQRASLKIQNSGKKGCREGCSSASFSRCSFASSLWNLEAVPKVYGIGASKNAKGAISAFLHHVTKCAGMPEKFSLTRILETLSNQNSAEIEYSAEHKRNGMVKIPLPLVKGSLLAELERHFATHHLPEP